MVLKVSIGLGKVFAPEKPLQIYTRYISTVRDLAPCNAAVLYQLLNAVEQHGQVQAAGCVRTCVDS